MPSSIAWIAVAAVVVAVVAAAVVIAVVVLLLLLLLLVVVFSLKCWLAIIQVQKSEERNEV